LYFYKTLYHKDKTSLISTQSKLSPKFLLLLLLLLLLRVLTPCSKIWRICFFDNLILCPAVKYSTYSYKFGDVRKVWEYSFNFLRNDETHRKKVLDIKYILSATTSCILSVSDRWISVGYSRNTIGNEQWLFLVISDFSDNWNTYTNISETP
jgi:hypothetical protein